MNEREVATPSPIEATITYRCSVCGHVSETPFGCCAVCRRHGTARMSDQPPRDRPVLRRLKSEAERQQEKRDRQAFDQWYRPAPATQVSTPVPYEESLEELHSEEDSIRISKDLVLPPKLATQCIALLAMRGMGKTYCESVLFEEFARLHVPVVAIDPVGAMWGLTKNRDGSGPGLDILFRGGESGDEFKVDEATSLAEQCIDPIRPVLLDLSHMVFDEQAAFMTVFLEQVFYLKRKAKTVMHVIIDEADLFAPQATGGDDIQKRMRRAMEQVVRRGRIRGLGVTLATQRPSVIHKNVLSQTQVLVALRMTSPQDREAIDGWVRSNGDEEKRYELLETLSSLAIGEAWFWSPGWPKRGADIFRRVKIRERNTYDSSKTPEVIIEKGIGLPPPPPDDDDDELGEEEPEDENDA